MFIGIISLISLWSNYRYSVDFDLKKTITEESLKRSELVNTKKTLKKLFEEKYKLGATKVEKKAASAYFFQKLRF